MDSRKTCLLGCLLVVTKRRCRVSDFCATKSKDFVATASRLSLFTSFRAALQRERQKNIRVYTASHAALPPRAAGGECKNSCCLGRGGPWSSRFFAAGRSHCFARSLCGLLCYFFVIQQRSNPESEPGRTLGGLPFRAALQSRLGRKTSMLFLHRSPPCHHARQAGKAKTFLLKS